MATNAERMRLAQAQQVQDARDLLLETVGAALVTVLYQSHTGRASVLPDALLTQINDLRLLTGRDTKSGLRGGYPAGPPRGIFGGD